jgi:hypothetical protein
MRRSQGMSQYGRVTDTIFFCTKSSTWTWNQQFQPHAEDYVDAKYGYLDATGRRFKSTDLTAAKPGGETDYEWKGKRPPKGRYWAYSKANMEKMEAEGRLHYTTTGFPRLKHYLDEMAGVPLQNYCGHPSDQLTSNGTAGLSNSKTGTTSRTHHQSFIQRRRPRSRCSWRSPPIVNARGVRRTRSHRSHVRTLSG